MRTTLSLDDDVSSLLEKEIRKSGTSFKEAVNRYIRLGLVASKQKASPKRFVVKPMDLGLPAGMSYDNIAELLESIEGPSHK